MNRPATPDIVFDRRRLADDIPMDHVYILTLTLSPDAFRRLGSPARFALPFSQNWRFEPSANEDPAAPWLVAPLDTTRFPHDGHIIRGQWQAVVSRVNMSSGMPLLPDELEAAIRRNLEAQLANTI